jgi:hypothetical protein
MKTSHLVIILGIAISSSIIFGLTFKMPLEDTTQFSFESDIPPGTTPPPEIPLEDTTQFSFESPFREEHYSIEITGMKDIYRIGEQYDFSYIISGYGYSCGSKKITFPDQNGDTMKISSSSSCIAGASMEEFVIDSKKEFDTTSVHGKINNPGIYNVTVTFDRPSRDFPTTAIKEFRVPPLNSWYNNQMRDADLQTVMNSCANDSPKERMTNSLRYTNETHAFLNLGCEWKKIGKFMGD